MYYVWIWRDTYAPAVCVHSIFVYIKCSACVVHAGLMIRRWPVSAMLGARSPHKHVLHRNGKYHIRHTNECARRLFVCVSFLPVCDSLGRCVGTWIMEIWMDGIKFVARIPVKVFYRRSASG